ncbi:MAG: GtrA family protein [Halioglobus sp.]|nr:GtrA family protein [Halioglobus sp.]
MAGLQPRDLSGQVMRFALVGAAATCTHYIVALISAIHIPIYGANLLGYLAAVAISYFGHQRYSFRVAAEDVSHQRQLPRFVAGSLGGLALSYLLLALMRDLVGAPNWLSLAVAVGLVPVYAFVLNKLWVFRATAP